MAINRAGQEWPDGVHEIAVDLFNELKPGDKFALTSTARVVWLMFGGYKQGNERTQVDAVRVDSEIGRKLLAWMEAGSDLNKLPCHRFEVMEQSRPFYRHDLKDAVRK